jgi:hypothetical protein
MRIRNARKETNQKAMREAEVGSGNEINRDLYGPADLKLQGVVL